jgi:multidrug efflux pump subunit AcrA (membrane-fusion protein)
MDLKDMKKDDLLAKCEEITAANAKLEAANAELEAANAELVAANEKLNKAPKGGDTAKLQQELEAANEQIKEQQGVIVDLNDRLVLADKTRGNKNPTVTIQVDGKAVHLQTIHGVRKGQNVITPKEIAADPAYALELYNKKSTAVQVVG